MNHCDPLLAAVDAELIKAVVVVLIFLGAGIAQLLAKVRQIQPPAGRSPGPRAADQDADDLLDQYTRGDAAERPAVDEASVDEPVRAEAVAEQPVGGQVAEHVQKYLDEKTFTSRAEQLGDEVAQTDRQIDQHLRQVFDHRVSRLAAAPGETAASTVAYESPDLAQAGADSSAAFTTGLLDALNSPDSLRQAIILSEIFHRPEERWG
jgi:hypothetical protein